MALPIEFSVTTLFGAAMVLLGALVLVVSGRYIWRATAILRATEIHTTAEAAPGTLVRVSGTIVEDSDELLVAPFSGVECVALRYEIEERRLGPISPLPWYVTVHEATGAVDFSVRTATGTVPVVEPVRTVVLTTEVVETTRAETEPAARIRAFEADHDTIPESTIWQRPPAFLAPLFRWLSLGTRRYSEQRAAPGADVTVVGRITETGSGIDPRVVSNRAAGATLVRMGKTSIGGLLIAAIGLSLGYLLLVLG